MNENERCDGINYGLPSCCGAGLVCVDACVKDAQICMSNVEANIGPAPNAANRGNTCEYVDRYYSKCRPSPSFTGDSTSLQTPISFNQQQLYQDPASSIGTSTSTACQARWQQSWRPLMDRCKPLLRFERLCFQQDEYYHQCRPNMPPCTPNYGQCGGRLWQQNAGNSPDNCDPSYYCFTQDEYYSQCRPKYERNGSSIAKSWGQCGGVGWNGPRCLRQF